MADFGQWVNRIKCSILCPQNLTFFFNFDFGGGGGLQGCAPAFRSSGMGMLCLMLFDDTMVFETVLIYSSGGMV